MTDFSLLGLPPQPYPGLRPYTTDERVIFFGRASQIFFMTERLEQERFLCITGPSGCGKSSLARTGLISGLKAGLVQSSSDWLVIDTHPSNDPFRRLARAIADVLEPELKTQSEDFTAHGSVDMASILENSLERVHFNLRRVLSQYSLFRERPILLLIDQFEELFGYAKKKPELASSFIRMMLDAARKAGDVDIHVVITIRADALDGCARYDGLAEAINRGQFLTPLLSREELSEIIRGPIALYDGEVDPAFVGWLLNEMAHEPDRLPLLQHAINILWANETERIEAGTNETEAPFLDLDDFKRNFPKALKRARGRGDALRLALSDRLDAVYRQLDEELQLPASRIFCALVEIYSGDRDVKRRLTVGELMSITGATKEEVCAVVDHFRAPECQYLFPGIPEVKELDETTTVRVMHECLLRQWRLLRRTWLRDYERSINDLQFLARSAMSYATQNGPHFGRTQINYYKKWNDENVTSRDWAVEFLKGIDWVEGDAHLTPEEVFDRSLDFLDFSERMVREREEAKAQKKRRDREIREKRARNKRIAIAAGFVLASFGIVSVFFLYGRTQVLSAQQQALDAQNQVLEVEAAAALQTLEVRSTLIQALVASNKATSADCAPDGNTPDADDATGSSDCRAGKTEEKLRSIAADLGTASPEVNQAIEAVISEQQEAEYVEKREFDPAPVSIDTSAKESQTAFVQASLENRLLNCAEIPDALADATELGWITDTPYPQCTPVPGEPFLADIPETHDADFREGRRRFDRNDPFGALLSFREIYEDAPNIPRLYRYIGWSLVSLSTPDEPGAWNCFRNALEGACQITSTEDRAEQMRWSLANLRVVPERRNETMIVASAWAQWGLQHEADAAFVTNSQTDPAYPYRLFEAFNNAARGFETVGACGGDQADTTICDAVPLYFGRANDQLLEFRNRFPTGSLETRHVTWLNNAAWQWATNDGLRDLDKKDELGDFFAESTQRAAMQHGSSSPSIFITISMLQCLSGDIKGAVENIVNWPATTFETRRNTVRACIDGS